MHLGGVSGYKKKSAMGISLKSLIFSLILKFAIFFTRKPKQDIFFGKKKCHHFISVPRVKNLKWKKWRKVPFLKFKEFLFLNQHINWLFSHHIFFLCSRQLFRTTPIFLSYIPSARQLFRAVLQTPIIRTGCFAPIIPAHPLYNISLYLTFYIH